MLSTEDVWLRVSLPEKDLGRPMDALMNFRPSLNFPQGPIEFISEYPEMFVQVVHFRWLGV